MNEVGEVNEVDETDEVDGSREVGYDDSSTVPLWPLRQRLVAALMLIVTIGLAVTCFAFWRESQGNKDEDRERAAAISSAEIQALTLTNVNADNVDKQMKKLIAMGSGEFLRQFNATASTFKSVIVDNKVDSKSTVAASGIVEFTTKKATVLVALKSSVRNPKTGQDEPRPYRLNVNLVNHDGNWLVERMEFVK